MAEIVGIGSAIYDMMLILDEYPAEDHKTGAKEGKVQCGGPCAVALIAASKLGVSAKHLGKTGDDNFGSVIRENLAKYGVDLSSHIVEPGAVSPVCIVLSNRSNSSRTCIGAGFGGNRPVYGPEDVDLEAIKEAKFLHVDGANYDAALYAAKKAHEFGVKVSMDAGGVRPGFDELLHHIDVLIPAEECAYALAGTEDVEAAARFIQEKYNPEILVITQGPKGGVLLYNGELTHYQSFKVDAIDTNGAGDVFHGAFDAALVKGMSPLEACEFASATSAIKCTHFGASEGAPDFDTVMNFLKERKAAN